MLRNKTPEFSLYEFILSVLKAGGIFKVLVRITKILFALVFHLKQFESIPSFQKMQKTGIADAFYTSSR